MSSYNIYIAGVGGQGVVKTSLVLGLACVKKGTNIVMSEIHGMSQRGGSVPAEIKIGDALSPLIEEGDTDLLIAFEPAEAVRAQKKLSKKTVAVINRKPVIPFTVSLGISSYEDPNAYILELKDKLNCVMSFDALSIAEEAGTILSVNMVMLGAAASFENFPVERTFIEEAIKDSFSEKYIDFNLKAFEKGFELRKMT